MRLANVAVRYRGRRGAKDSVLALSDVSLRLGAGEKLGVVGGNGAGKSTLLRVMAGALAPDAGSSDAEGASTALLSLNAGFDTELSGARNIVMHGMLTGLTRRQALARVPHVVQMSGLGDAIHRRVSTYSNGMRARLGFWTAMNLEPDILLVDEVLSVGDREFREESRQAMIDRLQGECAVVLASHNVGFLEQMCERAVWLEEGRIRMDGATTEVIGAYKSAGARAMPANKAQMPESVDEKTLRKLFVCGAPGSGSTTVATLLNANPDVALGLEYPSDSLGDPIQPDLSDKRTEGRPPSLVDDASPRRHETAAAATPSEDSAAHRAKVGQTTYVGSVVGNLYERLDAASGLCPDCVVLQVVREPISAVSAWLRDEGGSENGGRDAIDGWIDGWNESVAIALRAQSRLGRRFLCVSFDRLFGLRRRRTYIDLLRLLGLQPTFTDAAKACLDNGAAQVRGKPEAPASVRALVERRANFRGYSKLLQRAV